MNRPSIPSSGRTESLWTVPNLLCYLRLVGLVPFLWAAWQGHRQLAFWILLVLLLSDWLDGKVARWLDQSTEFGARLDSAADVVLYLAAALGFWWLEADAIQARWPWLLAVLATWLLSAVMGRVRLGRLPSLHTRAAKVCWLAVSLAALHLLATGDPVAVVWVLGLVILTNLEAACIVLVLPEWRSDVPSLWHALRLRRAARLRGASDPPND